MKKTLMMQNLGIYFPFILERASSCTMLNSNELLVKTVDDVSFLYDDIDKTIRRLPLDSMNMTENECRSEFGYRLRKIMERNGVSQLELSERTGIPQVMLSNYITGKNSPSFYKVDKIAKALGCSIDEFRYED